MSTFSDYDGYLFREGCHETLYEKLGCHFEEREGVSGAVFRVWAPKARFAILEMGRGCFPMLMNAFGVYETFVPGVTEGETYEYAIGGADGVLRRKADPFAFSSEIRPAHKSVARNLCHYVFTADERRPVYDKMRPMAIYEVHLGSWRKKHGGFKNYRELAEELGGYVEWLGFNYVELIGVCEHPFDGSWGYQVTGFFSPTSRYGSPEDFMYFVDRMHERGIGVILDFVPAHTPKDEWGLARFDGSACYEYEDPLRGEFPQWGTAAFDHGKGEVRSFLISSAFYWLNTYHVDGLRIDAVASMLHNNFCRETWVKNKFGGDENLEGIAFLKDLNRLVARDAKAVMIAEDSSIMQKVTSPVEDGGLGFQLKWSLGWMNDTLKYVETDPVFRGACLEKITGLTNWSFEEAFMPVLSHDETVHLKKSLLMKFPGTMQDKFGGLNSLYTFFFTFPGKKLLFMGQELAARDEWNENGELDWTLEHEKGSMATRESVRALLALYKRLPVLHEDPGDSRVFEWVNREDAWRSTFSYLRKPVEGYAGAVLTVLNFAPMEHGIYTAGVPDAGLWKPVFSTYDGLGEPVNKEPVYAEPYECDGRPFMLKFRLRAYESLLFERL